MSQSFTVPSRLAEASMALVGRNREVPNRALVAVQSCRSRPGEVVAIDDDPLRLAGHGPRIDPFSREGDRFDLIRSIVDESRLLSEAIPNRQIPTRIADKVSAIDWIESNALNAARRELLCPGFFPLFDIPDPRRRAADTQRYMFLASGQDQATIGGNIQILDSATMPLEPGGWLHRFDVPDDHDPGIVPRHKPSSVGRKFSGDYFILMLRSMTRSDRDLTFQRPTEPSSLAKARVSPSGEKLTQFTSP